ncbi:cyclin-SDS isoform X1 [Gossypium hirsutum]|uniref:Cyclin-SDS isoform X1 n=1 Tax=Gossypium hirsutum TaxID=3635 RepID=A0ABM2Z8N0_GOSHI|nr:cyclin-SDS isoform X1 [Gossypium hirsutum]
MKLNIKSTKNQKIMEPEALPLAATSSIFIIKKLRSKRPRRGRSQIASFVIQNQTIDLSVDSGSCSNFDVIDVSCDSCSVSNQKKRKFAEIKGGCVAKAKKNLGNEGIGESKFRRITRSYYKKEREAKGHEQAAEVSESSCVESNSGTDFLAFGKRSSKLRKPNQDLEKTEKNDAVSPSLGAATQSDISGVELIPYEISKLSSENKENDLVSVTSGFKYSSTSNLDTAIKENVKDVVDANFTVSNSESVVDQKPKSFSGLDSSHLACNEQFSLEEVVLVSDYSSSHETVFSELQSDFFPETSDLDFSDYTPLLSYDSGSQFSEKSTNESPTSATYSLFLEFKQQFSRSSSHLDPKFTSHAEDERQLNSTLARFENEEDEESYKRLRDRERQQVYLHDYAEEYRFMTDYGDLILQQRSFMIRWIVEQCTAKEFQQETIFLGVCLLDRFLSKGFFRNKRSLQIVGIACLALATRIEENQPYNCVRQRNIYIGTNKYSRNEVVAMEWLVMDVLNFQCFLPTIYNFLWYTSFYYYFVLMKDPRQHYTSAEPRFYLQQIILRFYLKAAKADADVEKRAKYLAVLALSDHEQLRYWPSTVAAGVVIMASMDSNQHGLYHQVIEIHMRTKDNDLPECMKSLDWLVQYIR